jgi:hypothetical protein
MRALAPLALALTSLETIFTLQAFHVLAMFRLFDGILAKSRRFFSIQHVQVSIHPFNSPIVKGRSCMVFEHF